MSNEKNELDEEDLWKEEGLNINEILVLKPKVKICGQKQHLFG